MVSGMINHLVVANMRVYKAEAFNLAAKEKRVVNGVVIGNIFENIPVAAQCQVSLFQQVSTTAVTFPEIVTNI